jgi:hypothetical protein
VLRVNGLDFGDATQERRYVPCSLRIVSHVSATYLGHFPKRPIDQGEQGQIEQARQRDG